MTTQTLPDLINGYLRDIELQDDQIDYYLGREYRKLTTRVDSQIAALKRKLQVFLLACQFSALGSQRFARLNRVGKIAHNTAIIALTALCELTQRQIDAETTS